MSTGKSSNSYDLLREKPEESGKIPFWGTRSGKIVIGIIVALVIIGAVVGGAVGGTLSKKTTTKLSASSPGAISGHSSSSAGQTVAAASSSLTAIPALITPTGTERGSGGVISAIGALGNATSSFGNQDMGATPTPVSNNAWIRHQI